MSSGYSANQYDNAFKSQRLQNWCGPKYFKERPSAKVGQTTFIANDRGHLIPGLKQKNSAWPDFKGTWDLPARIPATHICHMARSEEGLKRLRAWGFDSQHPSRSQSGRGSKNTGGEESSGQHQFREPMQLDSTAHPLSPPAEARSTLEECPITGNENDVTLNQDLSAKPESPAQCNENIQHDEAANKANFELCQ